MTAMYMDPATAVLERVGYSPVNTYTALSESRGVPAASTCSIAIIDMCRFNNELLCDNTSALVGNLLIISRNGYLYLLPVKFARYLASKYDKTNSKKKGSWNDSDCCAYCAVT